MKTNSTSEESLVSTSVSVSIDVLKPCYYLQRILAIWQPSSCGSFWKVYNYFGYVYALITMASITYLVFPKKVQWAETANIVTTYGTFGLPLFYLKYYHLKIDYDKLICKIFHENRDMFLKLRHLSKRYSFGVFVLFAFGTVQIILCLRSFLPMNCRFYHVIMILCVVIFGIGYWSCWLVTYCFECHIMLYEIELFQKHLIESSNEYSNEYSIDDCFHHFGILKKKLHFSQKNLHKVLSLSVAVHFLDMLVYTLAFFDKDFNTHHTVWIYAYGMTIDAMSIFIKLVPAAWITAKLTDLVAVTSDLCIPDVHRKVNSELLQFHQYLHITTQEMGYRISTVRVSAQLTTSLIISYVSLLIAAVKSLENRIL